MDYASGDAQTDVIADPWTHCAQLKARLGTDKCGNETPFGGSVRTTRAHFTPPHAGQPQTTWLKTQQNQLLTVRHRPMTAAGTPLAI